ncbi:TauD/TfdA dioxygenase family protein [Pontivivens insulae]|uniref:(R)-phenoxypropionate/alpha-ketoglutarate-dioxygenase n=1 Tax=Pontivivens insulae TaxID=1639689 RepID=A0A2R8A8Y9_9RHOB|nr:TauD/TfdA family dioxygenase [Pontivivens insulae]RED18794.1 taurine dioxygenase [Pontivivens insulae]SPF28692.1 (R)-phenoxypropionate/alpha-ketoglutarate-dioxygenase [Pontivivens insulae]
MVAPLTNDYKLIEAKPFAPNLGAEIYGVDLSEPVPDAQFAEIRDAFHKYQVLFFKAQKEIPPEQHIAFGKRFGPLHAHPAAPTMAGYPEIFEIHATKDSKVANGEFWHSDVSCDETPPLGTMLQIHILPSCGGDTMFSDMYAAYEDLSDPIKTMLGGLSALHSSEHIYKGRYSDRGRNDADIECPQAVHPIVRTHAETGRKSLFVNRTFTTKILGLSDSESDAILNMLFEHAEHINYQIRFRWSLNDMAFWDNRCCMHRAIWDYWPEERKGRRVTVKGERPV